MLLPTVQMEVSAGPASLGQAQHKICRFEQSHTQKDFFSGTAATIFFFWSKKESLQAQDFCLKVSYFFTSRR